jgi:diphthamide synthase (EF-2-diphthine--ammonia ligase)
MNETVDRVAMHAVRRDVLQAQAGAAGLPLRTIPIPDPCSNEVYQARMRQAVAAAVAEGFTHCAFGDLFLTEVRQYREAQLAGTGLTPLFPLWERPTRELAHEMIAGGLKARLTCVDTRVVSAGFAGRAFDTTLLTELADHVDWCGENGEFHTCAHDGPMFSRPLSVRTGETVTRDPFVWRDIMLAESAPRP